MEEGLTHYGSLKRWLVEFESLKNADINLAMIDNEKEKGPKEKKKMI